MSLINDALKRAQLNPPQAADDPFPQTKLHPVTHAPLPVAAWLIPAVVIFLVVAGIFFVGWATAHHAVNRVAVAPAGVPTPVATALAPTPAVAETALPPIVPPVVATVATTAPAPTPAPAPAEALVPPQPAAPPALPRLQGIFYSPTKPSAIINGKTFQVGDPLLQYHLLAITKSSVTLATADGGKIELSLDN